MTIKLEKSALLRWLWLPVMGLASFGCAQGEPDASGYVADAEEEEDLGSLDQGLGADCDPINTHCQAVSSQVCELTEDVIERVSDYVCILVPDPKWYNPGHMKKECLTKYTDKLVKGSSTCSNVLGLTCPSVTGISTLSCDAVMNVVSSCMKGDASACAQAHNDLAIAATFGPTCATYAIYQSGTLENTYESRLYNLVDAALDAEIKQVFGSFLGDASFDDYVRGTVAFYKTSDAALTAVGTLNAPQRAKTTPGKTFFNSTNPGKSLILHELVHIWQYRHRGVQGLTESGCTEFFNSGGKLEKQYDFSLTPGKKFSAYGVEQQAQIVQTYYEYKNAGVAACPSNFLNCASYANDAARVLALKDAIAGTNTVPRTVLFAGTCVSQGCGEPARVCISRNGSFEPYGNENKFNCYAR